MHTLKAMPRPVPEQISGLRVDFSHSIALSHKDRCMNYEELNRRADRFASHLAQLGVESNGTVAICMERSFDWIVAALGIMRAGAAYVPLASPLIRPAPLGLPHPVARSKPVVAGYPLLPLVMSWK
jgi:non-ribosomal peptide synthetase component F